MSHPVPQIQALLVELLHTLGMCLLVFRVLPLLDMLRALILLASIYTIPAFLKTVFEGRDPNISLSRKCSMFMLNCGAFLIQIGSIVLCLMYQIPMTPDEKLAIRNKVLRDNIEVMVPRPMLREGYFGNYIVYELPLALILISLAYWENFVDDDMEICGRVLAFRSWKKHLHHTRGRLYIFVSVWKALWVVAFAILLQPGFNFNLHYTQYTISSNKTGTSNATLLNTTLIPVASNMSINTIETDTFVEENPIALPQRSMFKRQAEGESILEYPVYGDYGAGNAGGGSATINPLVKLTEPTVNIENDTKKSLNITRSLKDIFKLSKQTIRHFELYGIVYIQIISSSLTTYFGSTACKLCMQLMGFSLPLMLILPVSVAFIVLQCVYQFLPTGVFIWVGVETGSNTWILHLAWLGVVWLSEVYIVSHIWFPSNGRMERIDRLFVTPVRCGILPDQSLMLRRRRNDQDTSLLPDVDDESYDPDALQYKADDVVPQIYACATMWHETRAEMTNLLKSLFRMDIDHSGRYLAQKFYKIRDPDYYEFEAHLFFDDAMELSDDDNLVPNMFVGDLMECIDDSLSSVHERQMTLGPPTRTPTPYGGRLTWKLPGGTKLIAHLKDKHKIRHKKRWSQVMYMYYLLGYRILAQPENLLTKDMIDGYRSDGEFQRVKLTESQLRRRRKAAHFTRSVIFNYVTDDVHTQVRGPLCWYQQFEYAIGHWLQKASEHVFGCVMCAPGCFSLFRGSAMMDDNVARTYATRATEAGHYVQYDQGAFTVVFKTSVLGSYLMALAPAIGFIVICIFASTDTQMTIASIMSAFYAIIMTIVLVGTVGQAIEGGVTSPNVVFLVMLVFIFFVSAIMHPEEFFCVIPGALYFICLPTGYLLLTIYYLCNMNVVSWGTREIPKRKTKEEIEQEKLEAEEHRRKKEEKNKGLLGWMGLNGFFKELGDVIRQARGDVTAQQKKSESDRLLEELLREIRDERRSTRGLSRLSSTMDMADIGVDSCPAPEIVTVEKKQEPEPQPKKEEDHVPIWLQKEDVNKPAWLNTKTCGDGPIKRLSEKENVFWKQIIAKYLHPITEDKSHQEKVQYDLKNLRNNVVFGFFMSSALWIALAMQLQILQEDLKNSIFIKIPRLDKDEPLAIEPLGLIFLAFFASILSVQFLGMLFHRWGTVMHMLSITELSCGKTFTEKDKVREIISKAMELQKLCNIENEPMPDYDDPLPDYGYSDEGETLDTTSLATADTWSINPPSYQANMPIGFYNDPHNRKQAIFNNRGNPSGAALRKAFEKRFRNEAQHYRSDPAMDEDRAVALYDIFEHDPANVV
ncbi:CHS2-like protein [Mya arenaria]|uniref:CHS2-like protein n=1 Tax=Mya arenaria TaxID=6604 RepID=A0ABY7DUW4_MYAAR|nr:CHS2-like protein [Mya arenaria]